MKILILLLVLGAGILVSEKSPSKKYYAEILDSSRTSEHGRNRLTFINGNLFHKNNFSINVQNLYVNHFGGGGWGLTPHPTTPAPSTPKTTTTSSSTSPKASTAAPETIQTTTTIKTIPTTTTEAIPIEYQCTRTNHHFFQHKCSSIYSRIADEAPYCYKSFYKVQGTCGIQLTYQASLPLNCDKAAEAEIFVWSGKILVKEGKLCSMKPGDTWIFDFPENSPKRIDIQFDGMVDFDYNIIYLCCGDSPRANCCNNLP